MASAVARFSRGNQSDSIEKADGLADASPMPTPTRAALNCRKLVDSPDSAVIVDQTNSPMLSSRVRTQLSARRPSGIPNNA